MQPQELTSMPQQLRGLKESKVAAQRSQGLTNALPVKTSRTYVQIIGENVFTVSENEDKCDKHMSSHLRLDSKPSRGNC